MQREESRHAAYNREISVKTVRSDGINASTQKRWTRHTGPGERVGKVKAAPPRLQVCTTFAVMGDAPASSKRSGKSTGLTSAAHAAAGVL